MHMAVFQVDRAVSLSCWVTKKWTMILTSVCTWIQNCPTLSTLLLYLENLWSSIIQWHSRYYFGSFQFHSTYSNLITVIEHSILTWRLWLEWFFGMEGHAARDKKLWDNTILLQLIARDHYSACPNRVNTTNSGPWQMLFLWAMPQKTTMADLISLVVIARHSRASYKLINKSPVIY